MVVPQDMFPTVSTYIREGNPEIKPMIICAVVALLYWILFLRTLPMFRIRTSTPPEGITCLGFNLMRELDGNGAAVSPETILQSMKLDYVRTLFGNLSCGAEILNAILEGMDRGAVVFLCSAGKDRTGIVAALVLYLCGVPREDIIADYIVSSTYNTNGINAKLGSLPAEILRRIPDPEILRDCLASKPEIIIALLDALEQRNIRALLAENGFSEEKQSLLVKKFTS